jgi:hypothetical protein
MYRTIRDPFLRYIEPGVLRRRLEMLSLRKPSSDIICLKNLHGIGASRDTRSAVREANAIFMDSRYCSEGRRWRETIQAWVPC